VSIVLTIVGFLVALFGIVGCILPAVPGPFISYLSLIIISFVMDWTAFSISFLIVMAALAALVMFLDYILPAGGARRYGASRWGVTGSVIGMIIGFFFFPPLGVFAGAFIGAVVGEVLARKKGKDAIRAGWGVFVGILLGLGVKLAYSATCLFFYIKAVLVAS